MRRNDYWHVRGDKSKACGDTSSLLRKQPSEPCKFVQQTEVRIPLTAFF
ncbi:hypothetical protein HMPREF9997_02167 [Corynebacterium durum F0235]|uniref:Uncharacterized protein n=1 Tax=Corynebacterium durum F0235 TaxID=1035195 RepID=L1MC27_9CORY|nr:hypothetical protein HMPREF9997_02167 [Corynebacterium durum F0235]